MGTIIRFRLLLIALALPAVIILAALIAAFVAAVVNRSAGAAVAIGLIGLLVLGDHRLRALPVFPRPARNSSRGARAATARAAAGPWPPPAREALGRALVVWLLSIATGFVVGICIGVVVAALSLPAIVAGVAVYSSGAGALLLVIIVSVPILLAVGLVLRGFAGTQSSTYWTMAFRRLELSRTRAYGYLYQASPPAPTA